MLKLLLAWRRLRQRPNSRRRIVNVMIAHGIFTAVRRPQRDNRGMFESIRRSATRGRGDVPPLKQAVLHVSNDGLLVAIGNRRRFGKGNFPWKVHAVN
jgi:hypothetical protein